MRNSSEIYIHLCSNKKYFLVMQDAKFIIDPYQNIGSYLIFVIEILC